MDSEYERLARYVAGECTPAEADAVRRWLEDNPEEAAVAEAIRESMLSRPPAQPTAAWDSRAGWRQLMTRAPTLRRRPAAFSRVGARLATAAGLAAVAAIGTWWMARGRPGSVAPAHEYRTAASERETITLGDGTRLTLAPASVLRVEAGYGGDRRDVTLVGEAVFTVVHDPRRPFSVRTSDAVARDIGTVFDVSAYPGSAVTQVVVVSGQVDVSGAPAGPGQRVRVAHAGVPEVTSGIDPTTYVAWTTGRLVLDAVTVGEALATISRWYDVDARTASTELATRHISATFTNEPLDVVLTSVAATLHARVARHGRVITFVPLH